MSGAEGLPVGIIGAGIVGLSTALFLQRAGRQVVLVDPAEPGRGASYGNAGCFNGSSVVPNSLPGTLRKVPGWLFDPHGPLSIRWRYLPALAPWLWRFVKAGRIDLVEAQARALRSLLRDSLDLMTSLAAEAGASDLVARDGHLFVYHSREHFMQDAFAWSLRTRNGIAVEELDTAALRDFDPAISSDYDFAVLVAENGHTRDPLALAERLAGAVTRNGGRFIRASAQGFRLSGARIAAIRTAAGEVPVSAAVIAAGAHSRKLAALAGDRVPLETERGYHLMLCNPGAAPRVPTMDAAGKFVATPMAAGLRLAGTVELGGLDTKPDFRRARRLFDVGRRLIPGIRDDAALNAAEWMGFRPSLPDSLPVIGRSTLSPDIVHAFGHGHVGMAAAASTGQAVTALVTGSSPAVDLTPFSPRRFRNAGNRSSVSNAGSNRDATRADA